jgi:hypothetical protein
MGWYNTMEKVFAYVRTVKAVYDRTQVLWLRDGTLRVCYPEGYFNRYGERIFSNKTEDIPEDQIVELRYYK